MNLTGMYFTYRRVGPKRYRAVVMCKSGEVIAEGIATYHRPGQAMNDAEWMFREMFREMT